MPEHDTMIAESPGTVANGTAPDTSLRQAAPTPQSVRETLSGRAYETRRRRWLPLAGLVLVAAGIAWWWTLPGRPMAYDQRPVERGELVVSVAATGTLKPLQQVDVGAEISGRILEVLVDFNSRVVRDQPMARLDTEQLAARDLSSRANLESARGAVRQAQATRVEAQRRRERVRDLAAKRSASGEEVDRAAADLERAEAAVAIAQAQQALAEAQVEADAANLRRAVIRSPIDGIVLDRRVEPGQTVASSFQTPVLFTLATDLRAMELKVDVDEASVGDVRAGQSASFSVSAFPGRTFAAEVMSLRNAPRSVQGVVSYEAILRVDNADLVLRPGMTATAEIRVARVDEALLVPNAALRFYPPGTSTDARNVAADRVKPGENWGRVWLHAEGEEVPQPRDIRLGATDGRRTEVLEGDLAAGVAVLTDVQRMPWDRR